jgi:hypothetical protein
VTPYYAHDRVTARTIRPAAEAMLGRRGGVMVVAAQPGGVQDRSGLGRLSLCARVRILLLQPEAMGMSSQHDGIACPGRPEVRGYPPARRHALAGHDAMAPRSWRASRRDRVVALLQGSAEGDS